MGHILEKCRRDSEPSDASDVRRDFEKTFNFLCKKSESLDKYLTELDDTKKVDCRSASTQTIAEQAEYYIKQILQQVEQQDGRFKNTLLQSGSFYDETKVGFPDEYDFMAKLELLSKPGVGKVVSTKLGFVEFVLEDQESVELWKEFLAEGEEAVNLLSIIKLSNKFDELVNIAMKSVPLPSAWKRNPCSLNHGPCAMLKFLVDGFQPKSPLQISIDLAPCITYPNYTSVEFPFYKYLKDKSSSTLFLEKMLASGAEVLLVPFPLNSKEKIETKSWHYNYREQTRVSFSMLEKAIFSQFASNSVEKRFLRVLKILRDVHMRDDGSMEEWEKPLPEGMYPDEPPSTTVKVISVQRITPVKENESDSEDANSTELEEDEVDIRDEDLSRDLLQTYIFKSLLFYAKLHQDDWFSGSLSRVVLECLKILFDIYSTPHSTVPNFFFDGYTGQIPYERGRKKILRRLVKIMDYLRLQTALQ